MTKRAVSLVVQLPVLVLGIVLVSRGAHADALDDQINSVLGNDTVQFATEAARRGLERFRRSVTLGPTLHLAPAMTLDDDRDTGVQVGGGLALLRYDIPTIPTYEQLKSIVLSGIKSAVEAQLRAAVARGEALSDEEQRRIIRQVWQDLKDELLLELRPRHLEKPRFELVGEVSYLTGAEAWDVRALIGIGVSKVMVAVGASLQYDDDASLVIPVELSLPVLLTDGLRSPVAQIFVRADIPVTGGDDEPQRALVGARFALDLL